MHENIEELWGVSCHIEALFTSFNKYLLNFAWNNIEGLDPNFNNPITITI